jgi:hypothetical protein
LQDRQPLLSFSIQTRLDAVGVLFAMPLQHRCGGGLNLHQLLLELGPRAALALAGVARQLDPVDGEHLPPDQPLAQADRNHRGKSLGNGLLSSAYEGCNGREVRAAVAAQGHECHVVAAGTLDRSAADNALRVGKQHNLQQHRGWVGLRSESIIVVVGVKGRQVQLMIKQVAQGVLERPGQQLAAQIYRQQLRARIDVLVPCHAEALS